jgi:molybdopterin/thiamine biosynthesis adenylyltransferase
MTNAKTLPVLVVGCGGVLYHGLGLMSVVLNRMASSLGLDGVALTLVDGDTLEAKNVARQWGLASGMSKAGVAAEACRKTGAFTSVDALVEWADQSLVEAWLSERETGEYAVVVSLPDNRFY